jgi:hypothetical protein
LSPRTGLKGYRKSLPTIGRYENLVGRKEERKEGRKEGRKEVMKWAVF